MPWLKKLFKPQLVIILLSIFFLLTVHNACRGGAHNPVLAGDTNNLNNPASTGPFYISDILPLIKINCSSCHNSVSAVPNWLDYNIAYEKRNLIYIRVVTKKDMPMGRNMSDADRALFAAWIDAGAPLQATNKSQPVPDPNAPAFVEPLPPDPTAPPPPLPVDGGWSAWIETQGCNKTCGGGILIQSRTCTSPPPSNGGANCTGNTEQSLACNQEACTSPPTPVNGGWSPWADVGPCSKICGDGLQTQSRTCNNPSAANGGEACLGVSSQTIACNMGACPVTTIIGYNEQIKPLFQNKCSSCHNATSGLPNWLQYEVAFSRKDAIYNRVFVIKDMPKTGTMTPAERQLVADWVTNSAPISQPPAPVNGGWTEYTNSGTCSLPCGGGQQLQTRTCSNPVTANGGVDCVGSATRFLSCNVFACPAGTPPPAGGGTGSMDGGWSDWVDAGVCSKTCGGGLKPQTRTCTNPTPANGGANCIGSATQEIVCNTQACAVDGGWSQWFNQAECSKTCGGGLQNQIRYCNSPEPANGGAMCLGESTQALSCNSFTCPLIQITKAECSNADKSLLFESQFSPLTGVTWFGVDYGTGMINVNFADDGKTRFTLRVSVCPATVKATTSRGGWAEKTVEIKN